MALQTQLGLHGPDVSFNEYPSDSSFEVVIATSGYFCCCHYSNLHAGDCQGEENIEVATKFGQRIGTVKRLQYLDKLAKQTPVLILFAISWCSLEIELESVPLSLSWHVFTAFDGSVGTDCQLM